MAHSRTERIGTIFTRMTSLMKGGAVEEENLPLWYQVYKAFPPKYEPQFSRPVSGKQIQNIIYKEDCLRAKFHKNVLLPTINLKSKQVTATQIFFTIHDSLLQTGIKEEKAYTKALESYKAIFEKTKSSNPRTSSMQSSTPLNDTKPMETEKI